jgi:hypothetical protein
MISVGSDLMRTATEESTFWPEKDVQPVKFEQSYFIAICHEYSEEL